MRGKDSKRKPRSKKVVPGHKIPSHRKSPVLPVVRSSNDQNPAWRISRMDVVDPFGWHKLSKDKAIIVRAKLAAFESRTWNDILVKDSEKNHSVGVEQLCRQAQKRLTKIKHDDLDELISLHLSGRERVWGYRDALRPEILQLLWWDPDHQVCPSPKMHT